MHSRSLTLTIIGLLLGSVVRAEDPKPVGVPKKVEEAKKVEKTATPSTGLSASAMRMLREESKEGLAKIADFLAEHRAEFESMSDSDRRAWFDNKFGKVEPSRFSSSSRGPVAETRAQYEKLSDAGKVKLKNLLQENREKLREMSDGDRRAFMEKNFKQVVEEDTQPKAVK